MDGTDDPRCVPTVDALVIDGANGVCGPPGRGLAAPGLALALAAVLLALALARGRARAAVAIVAAGVALAIPGWIAITTERADRPAEAVSSARAVERLHRSIRAFALARGCAEVVVDRCVACEPIAWLALAGARCDRPAPIELHEGALATGCDERAGTLVCGAP